MLRKVLRTGNSLVLSLPREYQESLDIHEGMEVEVNLDRDYRQVIIKPAELSLRASGVDEKFARQVAEFIEQYRPALEELGKK